MFGVEARWSNAITIPKRTDGGRVVCNSTFCDCYSPYRVFSLVLDYLPTGEKPQRPRERHKEKKQKQSRKKKPEGVSVSVLLLASYQLHEACVRAIIRSMLLLVVVIVVVVVEVVTCPKE